MHGKIFLVRYLSSLKSDETCNIPSETDQSCNFSNLLTMGMLILAAGLKKGENVSAVFWIRY